MVLTTWSVPVVVLGVLGGLVAVGLPMVDPLVPYWTTGTAAVVLGAATVLAHLKVHPWRGPAVAWAAFMVGMSLPLSLEDALWAVAALMFSVPAALFVLAVNVLVLGGRAAAGRLTRPAPRS